MENIISTVRNNPINKFINLLMDSNKENLELDGFNVFVSNTSKQILKEKIVTDKAFVIEVFQKLFELTRSNMELEEFLACSLELFPNDILFSKEQIEEQKIDNDVRESARKALETRFHVH